MAEARLLDARVLSQISSLELVARTVVEGFLTGLHRSPVFGFSQEFAEYRPYSPGDDPRFVDWNVYARTDRLTSNNTRVKPTPPSCSCWTAAAPWVTARGR